MAVVLIMPLAVLTGLLAVTTSAVSSEPQPTVAELHRQLDATAMASVYGNDTGAPRQTKLEAPYKTFLRMDPTEVPDHMLLAILLAGSTSKSPVDIALQLLHSARGDVAALERSDIWRDVAGVGNSGRARVLASAELSRRSQYRQVMATHPVIHSPEDAMKVLRTLVVGPYEKLAALYTDRRNRVIGTRLINIGTYGYTIVDPAQIIRHGLEIGASGMIIAHQHPSGDPTPSAQDRDVTNRVAKAGKIAGIRLVDHLVIGSENRWSSLAELGELPTWPSSAASFAM